MNQSPISQPQNQKPQIKTSVPGPKSQALRVREERGLAPGLQGFALMAGIVADSAQGNTVTDVDGNTYFDLCLGDTGSMTGHSPAATVDAIKNQIGKGITAMLPTADAVAVSAELARRFGLPLWQFTVSATDANRHVIRYSRLITGKQKIIVIDRCYHGSVDRSEEHTSELQSH